MNSLSGEKLRRRRQLLLRRLRRLLTVPRAALRLLPPSTQDSTPLLREFTGREIRRATSGFCQAMGRDCHGPLYKGRFPDGLIASVRKVGFHQQDNIKKFHSEVQLLSRLHHCHIVKLRGFSEGPDRFLVFDYMENGSLRDYLHDPLRTPLDWRTRLQIAIGVAAALEYLQFFCNPPVYNVCIDSANVFLDENFVPKLCDVSLLYADSDRDYREPQTATSKGLTKPQHVVFQFGVLILELVTGQSFESEGADLIEWIQGSNLSYSLHRMVDGDLGNSYDSQQLKSLLTVARFCTKSTGEKPTVSIRQILRYLQRKVESRGPS